MSVGILFLKENNKIHQFFDNITNILPSRIEFDGGHAEGYSETEIGVLVTNDLTIGYSVDGKLNFLEDEQGNKYTYGTTLPEGLVDISEQFRNPTLEELQNKNLVLTESVAIVYERQITAEVSNMEAIAEIYELILGGTT